MDFLKEKTSASINSEGTKSSVITISSNDFKLADLCAKDLWRGINFANGKSLTSDEELISYFAPKLFNFRDGKIKHLNFSSDSFTDFVNVCKVSPFANFKKNVSIKSGELYIVSCIMQFINKWYALPANSVWHNEGMNLTIGLANSLVKNNPKGNKYRIPMASRFLFFAVPDLMLFNYSTILGEKLGCDKTPVSAMPNYTAIMEDLLIYHWTQLSEFEMPLAIGFIDDDLWLKARDRGWWQRRVLDLALLIHFKLVVPRPFLQNLLTTKPKYTP
jgi:hypothetical protein